MSKWGDHGHSNFRAMCQLGVGEPAWSSMSPRPGFTPFSISKPTFCTEQKLNHREGNSFRELHSTVLCARPELPYKKQEHQSWKDPIICYSRLDQVGTLSPRRWGGPPWPLPLCHTMPPCLCEAFGHLPPFLCVPGGQEHDTDKSTTVCFSVPPGACGPGEWTVSGGRGAGASRRGLKYQERSVSPELSLFLPYLAQWGELGGRI